jgi:hypothetical protein
MWEEQWWIGKNSDGSARVELAGGVIWKNTAEGEWKPASCSGLLSANKKWCKFFKLLCTSIFHLKRKTISLLFHCTIKLFPMSLHFCNWRDNFTHNYIHMRCSNYTYMRYLIKQDLRYLIKTYSYRYLDKRNLRSKVRNSYSVMPSYLPFLFLFFQLCLSF